MDHKIKEQLFNNKLVDKVRNEMVIDENEYNALRERLTMLSRELKAEQVIDKELALILYSMPQMIRNIFLSCTAHHVQDSKLANRLEDKNMLTHPCNCRRVRSIIQRLLPA